MATPSPSPQLSKTTQDGPNITTIVQRPPIAAPDANALASHGFEWTVTSAILVYIIINIVSPIVKRKFTTEDADARRVDRFVDFQQKQMESLTGAINHQTEIVNQQTHNISRLTLMVDMLIRTIRPEPRDEPQDTKQREQ